MKIYTGGENCHRDAVSAQRELYEPKLAHPVRAKRLPWRVNARDGGRVHGHRFPRIARSQTKQNFLFKSLGQDKRC